MALIEFKNVNKYYGDYHALRDINLEIEKGQVVVLLGPSGSGKSTLIRTINALESIDNGTLIVNGHNVTEEFLDTTDVDGFFDNPTEPRAVQFLSKIIDHNSDNVQVDA